MPTTPPAGLVGSDVVLLMLAAPTKVPAARGRVNGVTRLEKLLYLAEKETDVPASVTDEPLRFVAYDYGPFSKDVYESVEILERAGLVEEELRCDGQTVDTLEDVQVTGVSDHGEYVERCFVLTDQGRAVADYLGKANPRVVESLGKVKDAYASRSLSALLQYVYRAYPQDTVNSKIRHKVM